MLIAFVTSFVMSTGFWAYVQNRDKIKGAQIRLLLGLASDRLVFLGMIYIERGWITKDEYETMVKYLYAPYTELGGNGLVEKVMSELANLPMYNHPPTNLVKKIRENECGPNCNCKRKEPSEESDYE